MTDAEELTLDAAQRLAESCAGSLSAPPQSVILHGSLAMGGFLPGRSDIDLLAVTRQELSGAQSDALLAVVRQAALGCAAGIDLLVVSAEVCAAPSRAPRLQLHVGRYPGCVPLFEVEAQVEEAADLVPELSVARAGGRALYGAGPSQVIGPVPPEWVRERGVHWLSVWQGLTGDSKNAAFMVLTACRIWRFALEDVHSNKEQAGRWVLERDPSLSAIRQALRQRLDDPDERIDQQGIARVLETALRAAEAV